MRPHSADFFNCLFKSRRQSSSASFLVKTVKVSPRARQAYGVIEALTEAGKPVLPNQTDVARALGISNQRARQLCQELRAAGLVSWIPNADHTLHVVAPLPPVPPAPRTGKRSVARKG